MRGFDERLFQIAFRDMVENIRWQEEPEYYPRYQARYRAMLREFADMAPEEALDVLEIGGGQLAYISLLLWGRDRACVADIQDSCFEELRGHDIDAFEWNIALSDALTERQFDVIFFSEVIEHLPVPGQFPLARLRSLLRPGGVLLCSTPNLYRLRNVMFLIQCRQLFDHFDLPGERGYGHVLEYSAEHLAWQLERAGFHDYSVHLRDFSHKPESRADRVLSALGAPLRRIPRHRDNLLAIARAGRETPAAASPLS